MVHNTCPADKQTKRQEIKELVYQLSAVYPDLKTRVFGAMQRLPLPYWAPDGTPLSAEALEQQNEPHHQQKRQARQAEQAEDGGGDQVEVQHKAGQAGKQIE